MAERRCSHCAGPLAGHAAFKNHWWVCARCGLAEREVRRTWADALPAALPLPPELRREASPAFFTQPSASLGEREVTELRGWLRELGLTPRGAVLDVGGGPGFAAASLAGEADRVVLLEHSAPARAHAAGLGVEVAAFDFERGPLGVTGPFDLVLARYSLGWCRDLPRFASLLRAEAAPGAAVVLTFVVPTRGAAWMSAFEDLAPWRLWPPQVVVGTFAAAGFKLERTFAPRPPMSWAEPHGWRKRLATLPLRLRPSPLPPASHQEHAGLLLWHS